MSDIAASAAGWWFCQAERWLAKHHRFMAEGERHRCQSEAMRVFEPGRAVNKQRHEGLHPSLAVCRPNRFRCIAESQSNVRLECVAGGSTAATFQRLCHYIMAAVSPRPSRIND